MAQAYTIEIAKGVLVDQQNQTTVTVKGANADTIVWFTQEQPASGNNKYVQYWIAFDSDPFIENVVAINPKTGKTKPFTARPEGPLACKYTIYTADPTSLGTLRRTSNKSGGGIIIDN